MILFILYPRREGSKGKFLNSLVLTGRSHVSCPCKRISWDNCAYCFSIAKKSTLNLVVENALFSCCACQKKFLCFYWFRANMG